jgi:hypothetical protein
MLPVNFCFSDSSSFLLKERREPGKRRSRGENIFREAASARVRRRNGRTRKTVELKDKGCDIGYALAASSCEGVNSMDACTVTAF